ncbi:MAG: 50S ribosomal protein L15e [Candidatus Micrarchaeia archaeon]
MGMAKYIKETFRQEYAERSPLLRERLSAWRKEGSVVKIDRPTNPVRAHELGYKAKQGVILARVKVRKGMRKREKPLGGRKPSKSARFVVYRKSHQSIAEERANRKFSNAEVLNSYYVGEDGNYAFYEVILVDRSNPSIANDKEYSKIIQQKGRAYRGLTSSGRKHRGLLNKGFGTNKSRPSVRSNIRGYK